MEFKEWMDKVREIMIEEVGTTGGDAEDWRCFYDDDKTPEEACAEEQKYPC